MTTPYQPMLTIILTFTCYLSISLTAAYQSIFSQHIHNVVLFCLLSSQATNHCRATRSSSRSNELS